MTASGETLIDRCVVSKSPVAAAVVAMTWSLAPVSTAASSFFAQPGRSSSAPAINDRESSPGGRRLCRWRNGFICRSCNDFRKSQCRFCITQVLVLRHHLYQLAGRDEDRHADSRLQANPRLQGVQLVMKNAWITGIKAGSSRGLSHSSTRRSIERSRNTRRHTVNYDACIVSRVASSPTPIASSVRSVNNLRCLPTT